LTVVPFLPKPDAVAGIECETEQAVLGACFRRPELLDEILSICPAPDFAHSPHGAIANCIHEARASGLPISPLVIATKLTSNPAFIEAGGKDYLEAMMLSAPVDGVLTLARNLVDMRLRREAGEASQTTQEALGDPGCGIMEALRPVLDMADHAADVLGKRDSVSIMEAANVMLREVEDRAAGRTPLAATTGLTKLDDVIGGLQGGDLVVYAGRPGMGKSALLMSTALRAAMQARPVIFFSLEMTASRLLQRVGCDLHFDDNATSPLSYSWFRNGTADHEQIAQLGQAMTRLPDSLRLVENGSLTIQEIAAMSRAFAARHSGMGIVVIDYLQKVTAGDRYRGNRVQEVTEISGAAKALAMRLKWPVVVGAQLNRGVENREEKRPALTDLRESGAIEQDADAVVGLYRPGYYIEKRKPALGKADPGWPAWELEYDSEKNRLDLMVLKNRNGAEDSLSVFCDMRASAIRDVRPRGA
jgi:replicative DNA helicase